MKTIILTMAAASALAIGVPAAAQSASGSYQNGSGQNGYNQNGYNQNNAGGQANFSARIEQLRVRIQAGVQSGAITRAEAQPLRQQLRELTQLERQYAVGGLTAQERTDLQSRIRSLRQQLRVADGGAQGQYGYDDDAQNGRAQNGRVVQIDRDRDGFDDRDLDRDGRWDDDARNSGNGPYSGGYEDDNAYEQPVQQRGGLGGLVDSVLGRGASGLRVGQRASTGLYALPSQYRTQYRDSGNAYFRTDGRQIYQIDARTQTVVRVYAMNR